MASRAKYRRKQYLIEKRFQMRYTAIILSVMVLVTFIAVYTTYYTSLSILGEKLASVYPQGRLAPILTYVNKIMLLRIILVVPFLAIGSILLSHRIAGPVYRIRRHLESIGDGDLSVEVRLRKNDELKNLADAINRMQRKLKFVIDDHRQFTISTTKEIEIAKTKVEELSNKKTQDVREVFAGIDKCISRMNENLSRFKTSPDLDDV